MHRIASDRPPLGIWVNAVLCCPAPPFVLVGGALFAVSIAVYGLNKDELLRFRRPVEIKQEMV